MAQRRMVSVKIIDSAKFIKMPPSSQALYFHLIARADDDGVVEAFNVMRMTGSAEDDLKILVAKQFATILNEDLVTYINDWNEHNLIRADRKIDSLYKDLLVHVVSDITLKEKKERADRRKTLMITDGTSQGQPMDSIGKDRLGKDMLGKDKNNNSRFTPPTLEEVSDYCRERNNTVDSVKWFNFYEAKGWLIGKNKMKDWKAAVRTWEKDEKPKQQKKVEIIDPSMVDFIPEES